MYEKVLSLLSISQMTLSMGVIVFHASLAPCQAPCQNETNSGRFFYHLKIKFSPFTKKLFSNRAINICCTVS